MWVDSPVQSVLRDRKRYISWLFASMPARCFRSSDFSLRRLCYIVYTWVNIVVYLLRVHKSRIKYASIYLNNCTENNSPEDNRKTNIVNEQSRVFIAFASFHYCVTLYIASHCAVRAMSIIRSVTWAAMPNTGNQNQLQNHRENQQSYCYTLHCAIHIEDVFRRNFILIQLGLSLFGLAVQTAKCSSIFILFIRPLE